MNTQTILTGDRPTGPLHLGHFVGSLRQRVALQQTHNQFVLIADLQGLTDNGSNPQKIRDNIPEVLADYLAAGLVYGLPHQPGGGHHRVQGRVRTRRRRPTADD